MLNFVLALNNNLSDYKGPSLVSLFLYLFLFLVILLMAYMTTKLVSKNYVRNYGNNMEIIEKMPLGVEKNLLIIRVGEGYYLVSNDKTGIRKIDKLESFFPSAKPQEENIVSNSFNEILSKYRK